MEPFILELRTIAKKLTVPFHWKVCVEFLQIFFIWIQLQYYTCCPSYTTRMMLNDFNQGYSWTFIIQFRLNWDLLGCRNHYILFLPCYHCWEINNSCLKIVNHHNFTLSNQVHTYTLSNRLYHHSAGHSPFKDTNTNNLDHCWLVNPKLEFGPFWNWTF